ncbi:universal stress protein [Salinibacter sp. 10B]|uniref:universal stress protein n=1 Tax=Salinibacter sp. 10B TaxID=1923971 RepID=UPI000CF48006|nr:universal stress protein [Salinibacter sp. 10B]PQJ33551.1 universal stress protein [Salinibacter sp. 10B]
MTLDNILLPTDFSACADHALTHAVEAADRFGARLHLLHVVNELDPDWYGITDAQDRAVKLREQIRAEAEERLQKLAPEKDHDFDTTVSLQLSFDVADSIHEYVEERNIDLVVMGTHGRKGLDRLMLGNVANKIVRHAPCPVMTVREEVPWTDEEEEVTYQDILAPTDFSDHSKDALQAAKTFASAYQARLHLLFVAEQRTVPTFSDTGIPGVGVVEMDPEIVKNAERALEQLDKNVGGPEVESAYHVREGNVSRDVVDFSETRGVDLIVMATRGLTGVSRFLLGSNTERIVRVAPCPVLTIPTDPDEEQQDA